MSATSTSTMAHCAVWQEHEWAGPRFLETGRHPTMGSFQKFLVRCAKCGKETIETRWTSLFSASRSVGPNKIEED